MMKLAKVLQKHRIKSLIIKLNKCKNKEKGRVNIKSIMKACGTSRSMIRKCGFFSHLLLECHRLEIDDSSLVSRILRRTASGEDPEIFAFFIYIMFRFWDSTSSKSSLQGHSCLAYYLHHAKETKFMPEGDRIPDYSRKPAGKRICLLDFAICSINIAAVITLLQYGARFNEQTCNLFDEYLVSGCTWIAHVLGNIVSEINNLGLVDSETCHLKVDPFLMPKVIVEFCTLLRILMRSVTNPFSLSYCLAEHETIFGKLPKLENMQEFFDCLFPGQGWGRNMPPTLLHICKCSIRQRLNQNWQLPDGIYKLELPSHLQDYLNLITD